MLFILSLAIDRLPLLSGIESKSCVIEKLRVYSDGWSLHRTKVELRYCARKVAVDHDRNAQSKSLIEPEWN